ncbi:hypothetical protein D1638_07915 [Muribaculaceae bacterium Z1]|nr:hypothetical protein [Muribaculaceae bacterium Z1]
MNLASYRAAPLRIVVYGAKFRIVQSPAKQSVKFLHSILSHRRFVRILHCKINIDTTRKHHFIMNG